MWLPMVANPIVNLESSWELLRHPLVNLESRWEPLLDISNQPAPSG